MFIVTYPLSKTKKNITVSWKFSRHSKYLYCYYNCHTDVLQTGTYTLIVFAFKSQICFQYSSLLSTQFRKMLLDPYFLTTQVPSTRVQLVSWAHSLCITWLPAHGGLQAPPEVVSVPSSYPSLDTADSGTDTWVKLDSSEFSWQTYLGQREISFLLGLGDLAAGSCLWYYRQGTRHRKSQRRPVWRDTDL